MEFVVRIYPDGKREHEVTKREVGENCNIIRQVNAGSVIDDERTGPDCDEVHETVS